MTTPIDTLLAAVDWKPSDAPLEGSDLHATHSGVLTIGDKSLRCYRLNDGRAIIDADDFNAFFEGLLS